MSVNNNLQTILNYLSNPEHNMLRADGDRLTCLPKTTEAEHIEVVCPKKISDTISPKESMHVEIQADHSTAALVKQLVNKALYSYPAETTLPLYKRVISQMNSLISKEELEEWEGIESSLENQLPTQTVANRILSYSLPHENTDEGFASGTSDGTDIQMMPLDAFVEGFDIEEGRTVEQPISKTKTTFPKLPEKQVQSIKADLQAFRLSVKNFGLIQKEVTKLAESLELQDFFTHAPQGTQEYDQLDMLLNTYIKGSELQRKLIHLTQEYQKTEDEHFRLKVSLLSKLPDQQKILDAVDQELVEIVNEETSIETPQLKLPTIFSRFEDSLTSFTQMLTEKINTSLSYVQTLAQREPLDLKTIVFFIGKEGTLLHRERTLNDSSSFVQTRFSGKGIYCDVQPPPNINSAKIIAKLVDSLNLLNCLDKPEFETVSGPLGKAANKLGLALKPFAISKK